MTHARYENTYLAWVNIFITMNKNKENLKINKTNNFINYMGQLQRNNGLNKDKELEDGFENKKVIDKDYSFINKVVFGFKNEYMVKLIVIILILLLVYSYVI